MAIESYLGANVEISTDNFLGWLSKTNQLIYEMGTSVVTAGDVAQPNNSNGAETTGNAHIEGIFSSNTIAVGNELRGGSVSVSAPIKITSNVAFNQATLINITSNTANLNISSTKTNISSNVVFAGSGATFQDNVLLQLGSGQDVTQKWDGSNFYVTQVTGNVFIQAAGSILFRNSAGANTFTFNLATGEMSANSFNGTVDVSNLTGIGTMATQDANSVAVAGGTITGVTQTDSDISGGTVTDSDISGGTVTGSDINNTPIGQTMAANGSFEYLGAVTTSTEDLTVTGQVSGLAPTVTVYNTAAAAFTHSLQANTKRIRVRMVGGGGGAAGARGTIAETISIGIPGNGGAYVEGDLDVSALSSLTVTIGAGGAGSYGNNDGANGADTVLVAGATTWTAPGGGAGTAQQNLTIYRILVPVYNPSEPVATGASILRSGEYAETSIANPGSTNNLIESLAGAGGDSPFGTGGHARNSINLLTLFDGNPGSGNGSGGGGCASHGNAGYATGGSGTDGMMIIEEFKW